MVNNIKIQIKNDSSTFKPISTVDKMKLCKSLDLSVEGNVEKLYNFIEKKHVKGGKLLKEKYILTLVSHFKKLLQPNSATCIELEDGRIEIAVQKRLYNDLNNDDETVYKCILSPLTRRQVFAYTSYIMSDSFYEVSQIILRENWISGDKEINEDLEIKTGAVNVIDLMFAVFDTDFVGKP